MRKSYKLYLLTFLLWIFVAILANLKLYSMLNVHYVPPLLKISWIMCILLLNYFWLFSCYHTVSFFISFFQPKPKNYDKSKSLKECPPVAVLYTTKNDFVYECAKTCVNLDYPSYHLFICDDSTDESIKQIIDQFWLQHRHQCTIIRRHNNSGFKAGNLNNALRNIDLKYRYIIIADHDSILPSNFIQSALKYFETNSRLAFVQAVHRGTICCHSTFSADLSIGVDCLWEYLNLKNRFGLVPCFGHGVIIRRELLDKVGGFPEIVSEDLGLTAIFREAGYFGIIANDIVCGEGPPANLNQFRRRYEKWIVGMLEFSKTFLIRFLQSNKISFVEKIDLMFHCLNLINIIPLFLFIVIINIFIPIIYGRIEQLTIESELFKIVKQLNIISTQHLFTGSDSTFLRILVIAAIIAPLLYFSKHFLVHPIRTIRHIAISFACFCSIIIPCIITMMIFFFTGIPYYRATGDFKEDRLWECSKTSSWWVNFHVGKGYSLFAECICCIGLLWCAFQTANLFLLSFTLGALMGPIYTFLNWDNKIFFFFKYLPFSLLILQLIMIGMPMLGYTGIFSHLVVIHF